MLDEAWMLSGKKIIKVDTSLGCEPRVIIDFLIMFTSAPAECGKQSKQRTPITVGLKTQWYMRIKAHCQHVWVFGDVSQLRLFKFCAGGNIFSWLGFLYQYSTVIPNHFDKLVKKFFFYSHHWYVPCVYFKLKSFHDKFRSNQTLIKYLELLFL